MDWAYIVCDRSILTYIDVCRLTVSVCVCVCACMCVLCLCCAAEMRVNVNSGGFSQREVFAQLVQ